ncbi:MAG: alpha-galactosidase [Bacteroidales bacterium]|nr:alpha-galactosidase [Bacteroidales bacterium]
MVYIDDSQIRITYNGADIFTGTIDSRHEVKHISTSYINNGKVTQVVMFQGQDMIITGKIEGSDESFPCESERRSSFEYDLVRHSTGLSHSLLNRAVYDRKYDWVLSVDEQGSRVRIIPSPENTFYVEIEGNEICLRFRPLYYQKHRGLAYFRPWEYRMPEKPVVGWCSWFAFWNRVTEDDIRRTADVLAEKLVPYGLEYLQIDDGYQREPGGTPESWLIPNEKFPGGMKKLAEYIRDKKMIPGIWTYMNFHDREEAESNSSLFVSDKNGNLATGRWIEYILDGSNQEAISKYIRPTYDGFEDMGWEYYKVDGLRHLRYDGYNSYPEYFSVKSESRTEAFRKVLEAVREEIGPDNYILACWGLRPELAGIVDACRIGTDGYGLGGLSQYNSFNNVVWLNDPDHIEAFGDYAYRDCMATSLTGSLYMITDKPEDYETGNIEPVIRTIPVMHTMPGQIYDVDPSRSMYLDRVDTETSGSGERIFDASRTSFNDLFLLEINEAYENWVLLGRTGERVEYIEFERLGLDPSKEYIVFSFWDKKFIGNFNKGFLAGDIDTTYNCQLFCIREKKSHPQLLATNRHISCGALEIAGLDWENLSLSGESDLVAGDDYILYLTEPGDYKLQEIRIDGELTPLTYLKNGLREVHLKSTITGKIEWEVIYGL